MNDRKTILYLLMLSTFLISMMALLVYADTGVNVGAKSSALYSPDTKTFLHEKNSNMRLPMASTTKIMTALIAIKNLELDEVVRVPDDAVGIEGSSLYLNVDDELTVRDLIHGVLLQSANDAAAVLAIRISRSISDFADLMTERANEIGAIDTKFKNPHGLDDDEHYTTARDLSLIAAEALNNDVFKQIVSTYKYSFTVSGEPRTIVNHNKLLKLYEGCIGVKTGYTKKSGRCLVSAAEKNGVVLVAVTLNDPNDWTDHTNMLNYGFSQLERVELEEEIKIPTDIPTVSSNGARVKLALSKEHTVKYKNEEIKYKIDLPSYITKDVKIGDRIGEVTLMIGDREENIDIIADCDVKITKNKGRFL